MSATPATLAPATLAEGARAARRDGPLVVGPRGALDAPLPPAPPAGRVVVWMDDPVRLIGALTALDGAAEALLLVSHAQPPEVVTALAEAHGCAGIVTDRADAPAGLAPVPLEGSPEDGGGEPRATRWLMTTSGTTGTPKVVAHTLGSLGRTVARTPQARAVRWGLVYDPTRFAGLQVVLQALLGGGTLIAPDTAAPLASQVAFLAEHGCTHLSATPTLWRRLLMVPDMRALPLRQATLGGEIVDQAVLGALGQAFPEARVTHIYASTEAGVGFSVADRLAGFPAAYLEAAPGGVALRVDDDGILWLRPPAPPAPSPALVVEDGYVRSGDRVERRGERWHFLGRDSGVINVGGVKVHPEAVERVIAAVPGVALARVTSKSSPITGALVIAEVQLAPGCDEAPAREAIQAACRAGLEREAVPARIRFVEGFRANAAGKLDRRAQS